MSEELIDKVRKDIRDKGYPLELVVGNIFSGFDWGAEYNKYYIDKDEGRGREIDISSYRRIRSEKVDIGLHLICEVKYCTHPWVIFSTPRVLAEGGGWLRLHYFTGYKDQFLSAMDLDIENEYSSLYNAARIGRSYYEAFKKNNEKSVIFGALASVVKAAEYCMEVNEKAVPIGEKYLGFVEPIIVCHQPFYEAFLNEQGEMEVHEIKNLLVKFSYISSEYQRYAYLVELVALDELPRIISQKTNWLKKISDIGIINLSAGKK